MNTFSRFLLNCGIVVFATVSITTKCVGQNPATSDFVASYISVETGATFSWLPGANNFFFPYVYPYQTVNGSIPQKMYFNNLGYGFGYTFGISAELPVFATNAFRFGIHYDRLSTQGSDERLTDCGGITGKSGMADFQSTYKSSWSFIRADIVLRQLLFSKSFYGLLGGDISYLIADRFDATQRIVSSDNGCQYYTYPDGLPTGRTDLAVNKQTSNNLYNVVHFSVKFGLGMFIPLGNNFFVSPEVQISYPLHHVLTNDAESIFNLNHSDIPRLWHADLLLSLRYAFPSHYKLDEEKKISEPVAEHRSSEPLKAESRKELSIAGKIKNCKNGMPIIADLLVINLDSNTTVNTTQTNIVGSFMIAVPHPGKYSVTATARGYLFSSALFDLSDSVIGSKIIHEMFICPEGDKIRLLVFFDYDKAVLKSSSFPELDRAARLVKESPTMTVEIAGYTDSIGTDDYNQQLSERRANAVRNYLIAKNIDAGRISAKGYGKQSPVASNETDAGRAENRRVEFVVVKQ